MGRNPVNQNDLTSAMAGVAITSPGWIHTLQEWSAVAGSVLPILGALWLIVQIITKIIETKRKK